MPRRGEKVTTILFEVKVLGLPRRSFRYFYGFT